MKIIRQICGWIICIIIGFLFINAICFAYDRQPGWLDTPNGASLAVREPYSLVVHGLEGYSIMKTDKNGYANPDKELSDSYVLMMGASHTVGRQVFPNQKYSALVNDHFADDDRLYVYNISCDGSFLPDQIKHFKAATEAFPNADAITIEIYSTDYSIDEIKNAMEQANYDENDSAIAFSKMPLLKKTKVYIKKSLPILSIIKKNMETLKKNSAVVAEYQVDENEYSEVINSAMKLLRSEYDKPIVFIYHPYTIIEKNGDISIKRCETWEIFKKACENNDIDVIDCGNDFLEYYSENKRLPYGFFNTTLGTGHLNRLGHRIIADEIIDYLEGVIK